MKVHFIVNSARFALVVWLSSACAPARVTLTRSQLLMGHVPVNISIQTTEHGQGRALQASNRAYDLAKSLEAKISEYQPDSEISCLNREAGRGSCRLSQETFELLALSLQMTLRTGEAFDIRFASPSLQARRGRIEMAATNQTARLTAADTRIGMASLGKGYIVDRMVEHLNQAGFANVLVDAGGDLRASGGPWDVAIQVPHAPSGVTTPVVTIRNEAWASAGNYETGRHIVDPRTMQKVDRLGSVTVRADRLSLANALATACFVLGPDESKNILKVFPDVQIIWTDSGTQK